MGRDRDGFSLFVRWNEILQVVAGGRPDALQTRERQFDLGRGQLPTTGRWHHLMLTYDSSEQRMRLYFNGDLLAEQSGLAYAPAKRPFMIGSDADWWFQSNTSGSLNGSVRELVFFERALPDSAVNQLFKYPIHCWSHQPQRTAARPWI